MKKYIFCALIALIAFSCDNADDPWANVPVVIPDSFYAQTHIPDIESRAASEYYVESWDETKTAESRTYAVVDPNNTSEYFQYWTMGDAISVFCTTKNLQYQMNSYIDGTLDIGKFNLVGNKSEGSSLTPNYYYSLYPYKADTKISNKGKVTYLFPETQHYNKSRNGDSYSNNENGMIAIISKEKWNEGENDNNILYFKNFCSYLQLRLFTDGDQSKKVKKITLIANDNTNTMAGEGTIEIQDENSAPVVVMKRSATSQITLDCGSGVELSTDENTPTKFWFVLPGGFTFTQGFSITAIFDDYSYFKQSTSKQIGIERNHIKPMATLKPVPKPATGPIRYKYNDTSINEPFPLNNTFYGEDGVLDIIDQIYDEEKDEWVVLLSGELKTIGDNSFKGPGHDIEYITVNNGDNSIIVNNFAFYNCTADYITINNAVDEINESAFSGSTIKDLNINGNVTTIKNSAGTGSHIEQINITGHVGAIEEQAFSGCSELQTLNVGSVETIGYRAFYMCKGLTSVNIPGVTNLGMGAFRDCSSLTDISLMSVVTIDDNAFMDCSSLTTAWISKDCTMIGEGAFCNAVNLKEVYCYAVYPPFIKTNNYDSSYVFDNVHTDIVIYIPLGSEDYYMDDEYFEGQTFDDPNIEAEVNWWYEEYDDFLLEIDFSTINSPAAN